MLKSNFRLASEPGPAWLDAVSPEWKASTGNGLTGAQLDSSATASVRPGRFTLRPVLMVTTIRGAAELVR